MLASENQLLRGPFVLEVGHTVLLTRFFGTVPRTTNCFPLRQYAQPATSTVTSPSDQQRSPSTVFPAIDSHFLSTSQDTSLPPHCRGCFSRPHPPTLAPLIHFVSAHGGGFGSQYRCCGSREFRSHRGSELRCGDRSGRRASHGARRCSHASRHPPLCLCDRDSAAPAPASPEASVLPSHKERKILGSLLLREKLLIITQCADKVPREALAARYGVKKRVVYGVWQGWVNTWAAAARGVPLGARFIQLWRFPLVDQLLFEWFMRIRSMGRKTIPISRYALQVKASERARRHYPGKPFAASKGFVD